MHNIDNTQIWNRDYKIPWDDADFSRRMLAEHLSQDHDLASRKKQWIDLQTQWIHKNILNAATARILDLGCGPGLYLQKLANLGHTCTGIDFGPASIEYAKTQCRDTNKCEYILADLRNTDFGGPYDLVMLLYGELNVFSPQEALEILTKAYACLTDNGGLIVEIQDADFIKNAALGESSIQNCQSGLFSDKPHRISTDNRWLEQQKVSIQQFTVIIEDENAPDIYRSTTQAWPDDKLRKLLMNAGFSAVQQVAEWPCNTEALKLWLAHKK